MPTIKQQKGAKLLAENMLSTTPETKHTILEKAGYGKGVAKTPNKVIEGKGFQEVLNKYLPDDLVAKRHEWLLKHKEYNAVKAGVDMAYKLKGSYAPEKREVETKSLNVNINQEQVKVIVLKAEEDLKKLLSE